MRHPLFLVRSCCRPPDRVPLLTLRFLVSARLLAMLWCLSPPAAAPPPNPPNPTPPVRLLSSAPPFASWCPAPAGGCASPPGGLCFAAGGLLLRVYPCCFCALWLLCAARPFVSTFCCPVCPPPVLGSPGSSPCSSSSPVLPLLSCGFAPLSILSPPPIPPVCVPWVALPLVVLCPPAAAFFLPCLSPWHLFGLVSVSPLGSRPFVRSVHCALVPCPPPPGRLILVLRGAPRLVVWCRGWVWAVLCGARCFAAPCCAVLGVPCCVVCCSVVLFASSLAVFRWRWPRCFCWCHTVLRCPVLYCSVFRRVWCRRALLCAVVFSLLLCSVVVLALFFLRILGSGYLRPCTAWCCPPSPWNVCRAFCPFVLRCCAGLFCALWCCTAACCVVLFGARRVLFCFAGGVLPRCVSSCGCALLRALLCSVALCPVVVRCAVCWGAASWCYPLCCPAVRCCGLPCAVWCPLAFCGCLCVVLCRCLLLCAVLRLWVWCLVALSCAVLVVACCFVLVALLYAVLCLLVLCWAVLRRVVLCGAVLLCTVLWRWCCAALSPGVWCRFVLWCALGCCVVPRVLCALLRAVVSCAVLLCFMLCPGVWCLGALYCAVRVVSCCLVGVCVPVCCAVSLHAVLRCVASCCYVRCSAVAHCAVLRGAVLFLLAFFGAVACCALPSGVVPCCGVLCRLVRHFAVLPRAVCAMLCVFCRCVVVCAVFCCNLLCCWCPVVSRCAVTSVQFQRKKKLFLIFKNRKNCFFALCLPAIPVGVQKKLFPAGVLPCVPCPPCMQQYDTLKKPACFIFLIPGLGLVCTAGVFLELFGCVLGVIDTVHLQQKRGQTQWGWGSSARRR